MIGLINSALMVAFVVIKVWAFVDCLTRPKMAFVAADRRTWTFWSVVTGVAALTALARPIGMIGLLGLVAALVYLLDVKPRLKEVSGSRG